MVWFRVSCWLELPHHQVSLVTSVGTAERTGTQMAGGCPLWVFPSSLASGKPSQYTGASASARSFLINTRSCSLGKLSFDLGASTLRLSIIKVDVTLFPKTNPSFMPLLAHREDCCLYPVSAIVLFTWKTNTFV